MKMHESLRNHRISRGIQRKEMADLLDVGVRTYQTYETGTREPGMKHLIKIADFYDISLDDLVGREFPKKSLVEPE